MATAVAIALSIGGVGQFTMRPGQRIPFWGWNLGASLILLTWGAWFTHGLFSDWYFSSKFPISSDFSDRLKRILISRYTEVADRETSSSICQALIAWTFFAVLGYRLERILPNRPDIEASEPVRR